MRKGEKKTSEFESSCRAKWKDMEDKGKISVHERSQCVGKQRLDESFVGKKIEYLSEFDINDSGTETQLRWCSGVIEEVCDGTWIMAGKRSKCFKKNEAARVLWDPIPEADMEAGSTIESFAQNMWNKNVAGA